MAAKADGLLENHISENVADIPAEYKDADGAWIAKGLTVVGFIANNNVLEEKKLEVPTSWEALADPKYKGEVIMSNPAISGTNYAVVKGWLDLYGGEKGWEYLKKLNENIPWFFKTDGSFDPRQCEKFGGEHFFLNQRYHPSKYELGYKGCGVFKFFEKLGRLCNSGDYRGSFSGFGIRELLFCDCGRQPCKSICDECRYFDTGSVPRSALSTRV